MHTITNKYAIRIKNSNLYLNVSNPNEDVIIHIIPLLNIDSKIFDGMLIHSSPNDILKIFRDFITTRFKISRFKHGDDEYITIDKSKISSLLHSNLSIMYKAIYIEHGLIPVDDLELMQIDVSFKPVTFTINNGGK